ncbi:MULTISPECIES: hypothetical protein [Asticcacaulis]|uniref:hypothetical protein n=1 Tax=Asticcacaulis TaxID=76890 RepID=UPI001AE58E7B|nr:MULTISPECIES: hypothetical protein [Asticcacaulis]MBP2160403.1 hypothetical protein [Asticcacaulis solisilvae]MDR6801294.1 hypothetical protein [Asticcacaulis sp. BE141]
MLHVTVVAILIVPRSGAISRFDSRMAGDHDVEGIAVSLLEATEPATASPEANPEAANPSTLPLPGAPSDANGDPADAPQPPQSPPVADGAGDGATAEPLAQTTTPSDQDGNIRIEDRQNQIASELWKAVEPCWQRMADRGTASVTLNIGFSQLGNLSRPLQGVREPNALPDDRQLQSEATAIRAFQACGPYLVAFGLDEVNLVFPAIK